MVEFKGITKKLKDYKKVKSLYNSAFPKEERAPFWVMRRKARGGRADFLAAYDGDEFVGLVYIVCNEELAYLFYLAVDDTQRGKGYGSAILTAVKEMYKDKTVFLALEEMDERADNIEERRHRAAFYKKNGMEYLPYKLKEATVIYDVMGLGDNLTPEGYDALITKWSGRLMKKLVDMRMIEK